MKNLLVRTLADIQEPIDCSDLCLHIALNLSEQQVGDIAGFVYKSFVEEFDEGFVLDCFNDRRIHVASEKMFAEFMESIKKCGYGHFGYDGVLKSDIIKNSRIFLSHTR